MNEDDIERAFWEFDSRHKGYGRWKERPQSVRDAFKSVVRELFAQHTVREITTRQHAQSTDPVGLDLARRNQDSFRKDQP